MSMALAHFAFGAAATTLVVTYLVPAVPFPRTAVLAGGAWGMVPDLYWVSPVAEGALRAFHDTAVADVFWLHRTLDRADPTDSKFTAAIAVAAFLAATIAAERREYRALAPVEEAYGTDAEADAPE